MSYVFRNNVIEWSPLGIDYVEWCIIQWRSKIGWLMRKAWMCVVYDRRWLVSNKIHPMEWLPCASNAFWKRIKSPQVVNHASTLILPWPLDVDDAAAWTLQSASACVPLIRCWKRCCMDYSKCLCLWTTLSTLTMLLYWLHEVPLLLDHSFDVDDAAMTSQSSSAFGSLDQCCCCCCCIGCLKSSACGSPTRRWRCCLMSRSIVGLCCLL